MYCEHMINPRISTVRNLNGSSPELVHADSSSYHESPKYRSGDRIGFGSNKYIPSRSRDFMHVLALELLQLSRCSAASTTGGRVKCFAILNVCSMLAIHLGYWTNTVLVDCTWNVLAIDHNTANFMKVIQIWLIFYVDNTLPTYVLWNRIRRLSS